MRQVTSTAEFKQPMANIMSYHFRNGYAKRIEVSRPREASVSINKQLEYFYASSKRYQVWCELQDDCALWIEAL